MFRTALFIIAKTQKQPRCPSAGEWINLGTARQQNTIQYQKEVNSQDMKKKQWRVKYMLLSERSQSEKSTYYMIPSI